MSENIIPFAESTISVEEYEKIREGILKQAVGVISSKFKTVFDENPEIQAIAWVQYTPYFNDGDSCEFGIRDFNLKLSKAERVRLGENEEDVDEFDINDVNYWESDVHWSNKSAEAEHYRNIESYLNSFAESLEDIFKSAFGDHAQVVCTREGFTVDEHDHE